MQRLLVELPRASVVGIDPVAVVEDRNLLANEHVDQNRKGRVTAEDGVAFLTLKLDHRASAKRRSSLTPDLSSVAPPMLTCWSTSVVERLIQLSAVGPVIRCREPSVAVVHFYVS